MSGKSAGHPISKEDLEKHYKKVDESMESINRGGRGRDSLFELVKGIGNNKHVMDDQVRDTIQGLRTGFGLFYEMNAILEDRVKNTNGSVSDSERASFMGAYSMFAAGSYISYKLDLLLGDKKPHDFPKKEGYFTFDQNKDNLLNLVLARYYGMISTSKIDKVISKPEDLPLGSVGFFRYLRDSALEKRSTFHHELVQLVEKEEFRIVDEFSIKGFDASYEEKEHQEKVSFAPVEPHEVAGNVLAKKEMLRDMDRMALFDAKEKKNPILDVGGFSWSVLYDGLPGTGKSTLFRMGLTRLARRTEQVNEFWRHLNADNLIWKQVIVDQGIKDKYYGNTGTNLLKKLDEAKKTDGFYIVTTDDIDLLVGDRDSDSGGSDNDILNVLMQYADGINTMIKGNSQWWAATNDATAMDAALRQRFVARYSVDGPERDYDFADILYVKLGKWIKAGIIKIPDGKGYTPFKMRESETGYEQAEEKGSGILGAAKRFIGGGMSMIDIGRVFAKMKEENPRFTGRSVHAVSEAIKKRINDYEIPEVWFEKPDEFFFQPYERRVSMLQELCQKVSPEIIIEEAQRYFESETRYAEDKFESDVKKRIHDVKVQQEVVRRLSEKKNE